VEDAFTTVLCTFAIASRIWRAVITAIVLLVVFFITKGVELHLNYKPDGYNLYEYVSCDTSVVINISTAAS